MAQHILGVEIGGTKLQLALGTPAGEILETHRGNAPAQEGAQGILRWFEREIPPFLASAGPVHAIGVGFGGPVESASGRALQSFQVAGWQDIPLRHWFEEHYNLPTTVANDTNAAGWAEFRLGAGRGTQHFFYTNIGSGIGGALIIDGKLHDGQGFGAGEMGHTHVPDWTAPQPGASQKLENLCSGWSIEQRLRQPGYIPKDSALLASGEPTANALGQAAQAGDPFARKELRRVARSLGIAIANVITLCHPERVALGGGVSLMGEILLEPLRQEVATHVFDAYRGHYEIVPCALGESVVTAGALLLAARSM